MKAHVDGRLQVVGLLEVADHGVNTFSGGMKRRLSVAMSSVGDPRIIFLDEPTTGLDPLSRRRVWGMIEALKPGRVLVLTTHSMEEADALGDQVAIVAGGRLRANGTPLFLKSHYGAGYQISLLTDPARLGELRALVHEHLPGAEIVGAAGDAASDDPGGLNAGARGNEWANPTLTAAASLSVQQQQAMDLQARHLRALGIEAPAAMPLPTIGMNGAASAISPATAATVFMPPAGAASLFASLDAAAKAAPKRASTGALTIAVPRSQTRAMPAFLRILQEFSQDEDEHASFLASSAATSTSAGSAASKRIIKEWGLSNSTLEEVFLRLAAADKSLNAPLASSGGDVGEYAPQPVPGVALLPNSPPPQLTSPSGRSVFSGGVVSPAPSFAPPGYEASSARSQRVALAGGVHVRKGAHICILCESAAAEPVVLYTSKQVSVAAADLICAACATREAREIESVRVAAASRGELSRAAPAQLESPSAAAASPDALRPEGTSQRTSISPVSAPRADGVGDTVVLANPLAGVLRNTVAGTRGESASKSPTGKSGLQRRRLREKLPGDTGYQPPVSFWDQFWAIFVLRFRSQLPDLTCRGVCYCCGVLLVPLLGVLFLVITSESRGPIMIERCAGGFYADQSLDLCDRATYQAWLTDAVSRTTAGGFPDPIWAPRQTPDATLGATGVAGAKRKAPAPRSNPGVRSGAPAPQARLLFNAVCDQHNADRSCSTFDPSQWPVMADFLLSSAVTWNCFFPTAVPQLVSWHVAESSSPGDASLVRDFSFFPSSAGANLSSNSIPFEFALISATDAYGAASAADLDSFVNAAQGTIEANSLPMNGSCLDFGLWAGTEGFVGDQFFSADDAEAFLRDNMPSIGVGVRRARVDAGAGDMALHYDLRLWAPQSSSVNTYRPQRANSYSWTQVFMDTGFGNCQQGGVTYSASGAFDQPFGDQAAPQSAPAQAALSVLHNALLRTVVQRMLASPAAKQAALAGAPLRLSPSPHIRTSYILMPVISWIPAHGNTQAGGVNWYALIWPMFTMFLLPHAAHAVAHEKASKLWAALTMAGMRPGPYFAATYAFHVLLNLITCLIYYVIGYLAKLPAFLNAGWQLFAALFLVWAHCSAGLGLFVSTVASARTGSMFMLAVCLLMPVANLLITIFVTPWPRAATWIPFLSYARASTILLSFGGASVTPGSELDGALLITFMWGCLGLLGAMYMHAVVPGPESTGVVKALTFPVTDGLAWWRWFYAWARVTAGVDAPGAPPSAEDADGGVGLEMTPASAAPFLAGEADPEEDEDVAAERSRVNDASAADAALVVSGLVKEFAARPKAPKAGAGVSQWGTRSKSGSSSGGNGDVADKVAGLLRRALSGGKTDIKRAVDGLDLRVDYGEVLGLLGPNGAGKTTTISCLTGHTEITSGSAHVAGYDAATQLDSLWTSLGVCPQFDTVWDDLTVEQHLYIYARVKGLNQRRDAEYSFWGSTLPFLGDMGRLRAVVQQVAEKVELDGDSFRQKAARLSGGQRRRLSIAIALIGEPSIVIMDEPTTGLDPETRRQVHRIIFAERSAGRAMVITTHSMEEADTLCTRIGIVAGGRLRAVGSQLKLKKRWGEGYRLSLILNVPPGLGSSQAGQAFLDAVAGAAHAFVVARLHPQARLVSRVGSSMTYLLPRGGGGASVAEAFALLAEQKSAVASETSPGALIAEFGLSQTTLEDVFLRVVEHTSTVDLNV